MADDENEEFVEEGAEGGEEGEEAPKSRKLLFIALAVVLLAGGAAAYFLLGKSGEPATAELPPASPPIYLNLDPPFVVNFETGELVRFLQVTVSLMTRDPATDELLKKNDPKLRNDLLLILGNQKYETISSREGKEQLRQQSLERVRAIVQVLGGKAASVEDLYFTSFVMQ